MRHTCKIRNILFRKEYGTQFGSPTNVNNISRICLQTQSRGSNALNGPQSFLWGEGFTHSPTMTFK